MKSVSLSGSPRENVGKKDASLLRREERVPAVLYGGKEQVHFHISEKEAKKIVFTPNVYLINIDINGTTKKAIIQEIQQDPITDKVVHIDFKEVIEGQPVKVKLPVSLEGFAVGVRNGGKLRQHFRRLAVVGLEKDLPEKITIDITNVNIGGKVRVGEVNVNGLKFTDPSAAVIVAVQMARGAKKVEEPAK